MGACYPEFTVLFMLDDSIHTFTLNRYKLIRITYQISRLMLVCHVAKKSSSYNATKSLLSPQNDSVGFK